MNRSALVVAAVAAAFQIPSVAATAVISTAEQADRDNDRLRILEDELAGETRSIETLTRRRADRLAVGDAEGVADAEQAIARGAGNVAALRREIAGVQRVAGATAASRPMPAEARAVKQPATQPVAAVPWWDVYRRTPRETVAAGTTSPVIRSGSATSSGATQ